MAGTFYIVATPIGNLEDITLRALRILRQVDVIYAEDTRVTSKLCARYDITTPLKSYHQRSTPAVATALIALLEEGKSVALVTDAGTPGIADPGNELIARVVGEAPGVRIEPVAGASSLTAALSVCGFPTNEFVFVGFLPHKKGRMTALNKIKDIDKTVILFESPHRILKLFEELNSRMPERSVTIIREATKLHESTYRGSVAELSAQVESEGIPQRGEFVVILGPC